ncbi:MAG: DNA repair protein RadA [Armatimonadetes bacterium]|nr:DNA repair protein RadA [Armatimonadota bacterium]
MPKTTTQFVCGQCGFETPKWMGKCPECSEWNTLAEESLPTAPPVAAGKRGGSSTIPLSRPERVNQVNPLAERRLTTEIGEFDRVLGGGIVPGSLVLIGGDPGIGKSTLLTQVAGRLAGDSGPILYVSGEESAHQIRLRADRLNVGGGDLFLASETDIMAVENQVHLMKPRLLVVDSIQTVYHPQIESAPSTVGQVRGCTSTLMRLAKMTHIPVFIVGHVTKEGTIAGPRVVEHLVDAVLYFEGDRSQTYRILRAVKNRFGSTNEIGLFEMAEGGLEEVPNPSEYLLSERNAEASGTVVTPAMEGSRPLLVEVQALTVPSYTASPRRVATGLDYNRLMLLLAVLEKRLGMRLAQQDVFANVAGGVRLIEPSADLAVALAVASTLQDLAVPPDLIVMGEVGLSGELRAVGQAERRLTEAARLGFKRAILPERNLTRLPKELGLQVQGADTLQRAIGLALAD